MRCKEPEMVHDFVNVYCKGWHWEVIRPITLFMQDAMGTMDAGKAKYETYYPGDIIRDRYFPNNHWCLVKNCIKLLSDNNLRNIDDEWNTC